MENNSQMARNTSTSTSYHQFEGQSSIEHNLLSTCCAQKHQDTHDNHQPSTSKYNPVRHPNVSTLQEQANINSYQYTDYSTRTTSNPKSITLDMTGNLCGRKDTEVVITKPLQIEYGEIDFVELHAIQNNIVEPLHPRSSMAVINEHEIYRMECCSPRDEKETTTSPHAYPEKKTATRLCGSLKLLGSNDTYSSTLHAITILYSHMLTNPHAIETMINIPEEILHLMNGADITEYMYSSDNSRQIFNVLNKVNNEYLLHLEEIYNMLLRHQTDIFSTHDLIIEIEYYLQLKASINIGLSPTIPSPMQRNYIQYGSQYYTPTLDHIHTINLIKTYDKLGETTTQLKLCKNTEGSYTTIYTDWNKGRLHINLEGLRVSCRSQDTDKLNTYKLEFVTGIVPVYQSSTQAWSTECTEHREFNIGFIPMYMSNLKTNTITICQHRSRTGINLNTRAINVVKLNDNCYLYSPLLNEDIPVKEHDRPFTNRMLYSSSTYHLQLVGEEAKVNKHLLSSDAKQEKDVTELLRKLDVTGSRKSDDNLTAIVHVTNRDLLKANKEGIVEAMEYRKTKIAISNQSYANFVSKISFSNESASDFKGQQLAQVLYDSLEDLKRVSIDDIRQYIGRNPLSKNATAITKQDTDTTRKKKDIAKLK